jgi:hypothetical protein
MILYYDDDNSTAVKVGSAKEQEELQRRLEAIYKEELKKSGGSFKRLDWEELVAEANAKSTTHSSCISSSTRDVSVVQILILLQIYLFFEFKI